MSENLDLVRSLFAAWQHGDFSWSEWADPGIEFVIADGPAPDSWSGLDGLREGWRDLANTWEGYRADAQEYRELDDERVLVLVHRRGRGKTSGREIGQLRAEGANLFHVRDGKVIRIVFYFDRDRAFADLGLAPEADSP